MAHRYLHSTTMQAAEIVEEAGVRKLVLTNIRSRYGKDDWIPLRDKARTVFSASEIADDFLELAIPYENGIEEEGR